MKNPTPLPAPATAPSERNGAAAPVSPAAAPTALLVPVGGRVITEWVWVGAGIGGKVFSITAELPLADDDGKPRSGITAGAAVDEAWEAIEAKIEELKRAG